MSEITLMGTLWMVSTELLFWVWLLMGLLGFFSLFSVLSVLVLSKIPKTMTAINAKIEIPKDQYDIFLVVLCRGSFDFNSLIYLNI